MIFNAATQGGIREEDINAALLQALDPDFKADNIAEGVDLFGLVGTHEGGGKFATGTATPTSASTGTSMYYIYSVQVSGLSFQPQHVVLLSNQTTSSNITLFSIDTTGRINPNKTISLTLTLNPDGFLVKTPAMRATGEGMMSGSYTWIAWAD